MMTSTTTANSVCIRREQDGCHNCEHVFVKCDWDETCAEYFCTLGAVPRSPLGDVYGVLVDGWDAWKEGREVKPWCTCTAHEVGEEGGTA